MAVKVLMEFNSARYSWSEAHVYNGTSDPTDVSLVTQLTTLATLRVACLGQGASLARFRVSTIPAAGAVVDYLAPPLASISSWPTPSSAFPAYLYNAEVSGLALVVRMNAFAPARASTIYMAGLPMGVFGENGPNPSGVRWDLAPAVLPRVTAYLTFLSTRAFWGFFSRRFSNYAPAIGPLVTNSLFAGQVGITLANPLAASLPVGTQMIVRGWRRLSTRQPGLTGVYYLGGTLTNATTPPSYTYFLQRTANVSPSNFFTQGQLGILNEEYTDYTGYNLVDATTRKRGASLGAPRGRSSRRA